MRLTAWTTSATPESGRGSSSGARSCGRARRGAGPAAGRRLARRVDAASRALPRLPRAVPALGLGLLTTPRVVAWVRAWANWRRLVAVRWGGVRIPPRYRAAPADAGRWARALWVLRDPATWRELGWLPSTPCSGSSPRWCRPRCSCYPFEGFALALGLWRVFTDGTYVGWWYGFVPGRRAGQRARRRRPGSRVPRRLLLADAPSPTPPLPVHPRPVGTDRRELAERVRC